MNVAMAKEKETKKIKHRCVNVAVSDFRISIRQALSWVTWEKAEGRLYPIWESA